MFPKRKLRKKNFCGNTQALQVSDTPMWPKLGDFSAFFMILSLIPSIFSQGDLSKWPVSSKRSTIFNGYNQLLLVGGFQNKPSSFEGPGVVGMTVWPAPRFQDSKIPRSWSPTWFSTSRVSTCEVAKGLMMDQSSRKHSAKGEAVTTYAAG